jgi:hypothetical protein
LREDLGVDPLVRDLDEQIAKLAALRAPHEAEADAVCPSSEAGM